MVYASVSESSMKSVITAATATPGHTCIASGGCNPVIGTEWIGGGLVNRLMTRGHRYLKKRKTSKSDMKKTFLIQRVVRICKTDLAEAGSIVASFPKRNIDKNILNKIYKALEK